MIIFLTSRKVAAPIHDHQGKDSQMCRTWSCLAGHMEFEPKDGPYAQGELLVWYSHTVAIRTRVC